MPPFLLTHQLQQQQSLLSSGATLTQHAKRTPIRASSLTAFRERTRQGNLLLKIDAPLIEHNTLANYLSTFAM